MLQAIFTSSPVAFVVLLGVLVFVHELGHFVVAKLTGVRVLTFSIGFGPRILGYTWGDTDYRISAIPLGGYVRMYGDESMQGEVPDDEKDVAYLYKSVPARLAIAAAGPVANFVFPILLLFFVFWGTAAATDPVVGEVLDGSAAQEAGLQSRDRIVSVDGKPVASFAELNAIVGPAYGKSLRFDIERNGTARTVDVTPRAYADGNVVEGRTPRGRIGIYHNTVKPIVVVEPGSPAAKAGVHTGDEVIIVNDFALQSRDDFDKLFDEGNTSVSITLMHTPQPPTDQKTKNAAPDAKNAPAKTAKPAEPVKKILALQRAPSPSTSTSKTRIVKHAVSSEELAEPSLAARIQHAQQALEEDRVATLHRFGMRWQTGWVRSVKPNTTAAVMGVDKGDHVISIDGQRMWVGIELGTLQEAPEAIHVIGLRKADGSAEVLVFRMDRRSGWGEEDFFTLGLGIHGPTRAGPTHTIDIGPADAFVMAAAKTGGTMVFMVKSVAKLFTGQLTLKSVGSPFAIAGMAGDAAKRGLNSFLELMVLISVSLGVFNLLPIPVLDGGHIAMFLVEAVRGKKASLQAQERWLTLGLVLVGLFMLVAFFNDFMRGFMQ